MKQPFTPHTKENPAPSLYPETPGSMKQLFVLLWVLWANMLWVFGVPSYYFLFVRHGDWRALVSVPLLLLTLFAGWRLFLRSRREWRRSG